MRLFLDWEVRGSNFGQIEYSVAYRLPQMRYFFERSWDVHRLEDWRRELITLCGIIQQMQSSKWAN